MNCVFEQLMYDSGLTAQGCWDSMDTYDRRAIQKFARLIVQECAKVALDSDLPKMSGPGLSISNEIYNHFGMWDDDDQT